MANVGDRQFPFFIYKDPSGKAYFAEAAASAGEASAASLVPHLPTPRLPTALRPLPDAETAAVLNRIGRGVGSLENAAASGTGPAAAAFRDASHTDLLFFVGAPYPALQFGALASDGSGVFYVLELDGKRGVPDDATLASLGYVKSEATLLSSHDLSLIATGPRYLPVGPDTQIVVRGSNRPDVYLYKATPAVKPQIGPTGAVERAALAPLPVRANGTRALLLGPQTIAYWTAKCSFFGEVDQGEIDAIPFADPPQRRDVMVKTATILSIECVEQASRAAMVDLGSPIKDHVKLSVTADPDQSKYGEALSHVYQRDLWTGTLSDNGSAKLDVPVDFGVYLAIGVHVDNDTTVSDVDSKGWLFCDEATIWLDTSLFDAGDHLLTFKARRSFLGATWDATYQVRVRIDAATGPNRPALVDPKNYPENIHRIKHLFVLMLENRSFDHLLAANTKLQPLLKDALEPISTSTPPDEKNAYAPLDEQHDELGTLDAGHAINNVFEQIYSYDTVNTDDKLGANHKILDAKGHPIAPPNAALRPIDFAESFAKRNKLANGLNAIGCMQSPLRAASINALAENFTVFDRWHSSVPGPTWPNRFFVHCGTSGGISFSPDDLGDECLAKFTTGHGFSFKNGHVFQRLTDRGIPWRVYHDGVAQLWGIQGLSPFFNAPEDAPLLYPLVLSLAATVDAISGDNVGGAAAAIAEVVAEIAVEALLTFDPIVLWEIAREAVYVATAAAAYLGSDASIAGGSQRGMAHFANDVASGYVPFYTFIEPKQAGSPNNSGHPAYGDEALSEGLIASVYGALRASPMWESGECALLVVYDEHGGLFDHVVPPLDLSSYGTADTDSPYRTWDDAALGVEKYHYTFDFSLLGIRVPAILVSPYTEQSRVNGMVGAPARVVHDIFDHSSIVKSIQLLIGDTSYLSNRVAKANDFGSALGTLPLAPGEADRAPGSIVLPPTSTISVAPDGSQVAPRLGSTSVASFDDKTPIPATSSPNIRYALARAAEIQTQCETLNDPAIRSRVTAAAKPSASGVNTVQADFDARLASHRKAAAALTTMGDANRYLAAADDALEQYRGTLVSVRTTMGGLSRQSPKTKYAAIRAQIAKEPRRR